MAADVLSHSGGSYDDLPEAELRTVLAVPLALPQAVPSGPGPSPAAPARAGRSDGPVTPSRHRAAAGSRHRAGGRRHARHRALPKPATGPVATVQVGLSAALTVFVAVAVLLVLAEVFLG